MTTRGIKGILIETHDWGKTVAFWTALGYVLEFETDHHSGQLRHPSGGPYLFVAERAEGTPLKLQVSLGVDDPRQFTPPPSGRVVHEFEVQHWGDLQMMLADPDGRELSVNAPSPNRKDHHRG